MIFIVLKVSNWKETDHGQLVIELSYGNAFPKLNNPTHEIEQKNSRLTYYTDDRGSLCSNFILFLTKFMLHLVAGETQKVRTNLK